MTIRPLLQSMSCKVKGKKHRGINLSVGLIWPIYPSPEGVPQVEVAFDIDANGILNVSATDKATGKEQSIVINFMWLSEEEIEKMVKDAESHADEDKKFQEMVNAKNQAESLTLNREISRGTL